MEVSGGAGILSQMEKKDILLLIEFNRFAIEDTDSLTPTVRIDKEIKSFQMHPEKFYLKKKNVSVAPIETTALGDSSAHKNGENRK